jgi:hypothetical protein
VVSRWSPAAVLSRPKRTKKPRWEDSIEGGTHKYLAVCRYSEAWLTNHASVRILFGEPNLSTTSSLVRLADRRRRRARQIGQFLQGRRSPDARTAGRTHPERRRR